VYCSFYDVTNDTDRISSRERKRERERRRESGIFLIPSCLFLDAFGIHGQTRNRPEPFKVQSSSPKLLTKLANATIKCAKLGVTRVPFASFVDSSGQSAGRLIMRLQLPRRLIKSDSSTLSPSPSLAPAFGIFESIIVPNSERANLLVAV